MGTLLSEKGRKAILDPQQARLLNVSFLLSVSHVAPLPLKEDLFLTCRHIHVVRHREGVVNPMHQHREIEIQYPLHGEYVFDTRLDNRTLSPGEGIALAPEQVHSSQCLKEGVRLTALVSCAGLHGPQLAEELASRTSDRIVPFAGEDLAELIDLLFELLLDDQKGIWQREMIGGLLQLWLGKVLKSSFDFEPWVPTAPSISTTAFERGALLCERALEFIYANYQHAISVGDIAHYVGITPRHLNRLFHQHSGNSVNATLQNVRLSEAFKMLNSDPTLPIKEVAYTTGFTSPSYFTQCFKRKYDTLPNDVSRDLTKTLQRAMENEFRFPDAESERRS